MSERYVLESAIIRDIIHDTNTNHDLSDYQVCELLNELTTENEQLKQQLQNTHKLIDEKIRLSCQHRTPIGLIDYGKDLGYWNGVYFSMKELRKELR